MEEKFRMTDYSTSSEAKVETPEGVTLITFPARNHSPLIEWEYPEFQSLCPVSERHDQGVITIQYNEPDWLIVTINWSSRGGIIAKTTSKRGDAPS
jgi:NADPH-dependent 7-cyano-7-deazaguanine reductase QueF